MEKRIPNAILSTTLGNARIMINDIRKEMDAIYSSDKEIQHQTFLRLIAESEKPASWAYLVWDELVENLSHQNNRIRAISAQILCNLVKSDPEDRIRHDFDALLAVTKDERFVTARHAMQAIWKVGIENKARRKMLLHGLHQRFAECAAEKNHTLIRYDILHGMRTLYDRTQDESIKTVALEWIELETDIKYRKKYLGLWKNA